MWRSHTFALAKVNVSKIHRLQKSKKKHLKMLLSFYNFFAITTICFFSSRWYSAENPIFSRISINLSPVYTLKSNMSAHFFILEFSLALPSLQIRNVPPHYKNSMNFFKCFFNILPKIYSFKCCYNI